MDTGLLIALLNPTIALALGAAFLVLWSYQRHRPYLAVLGASYCLSAPGFLLQYFTLPIGLALTKLVSNGCFTIAACCLSSGIIARYGRRVPYVGIAVMTGGGLAAFLWFMFVQPDLTWRVLVMNFGFGALSLLVAAELRTVRNNGPTEKILFALSLLSGLNFIVRTLVVVIAHGPFPSYDGFYGSSYWTTALLSHALMSLLIALCLFTAAALDVMRALKAETHTDPLSGILNRRGFEERATLLLDQCGKAGFPVALVLADLDHFKALNDRHGHEAGDRVIADFAAKLRSATGARGAAGRIGGEEFAVLLPLSDLAAARLFAEAIRALYSAGTVDGLPPGTRVTASFGVAARTGKEGLMPLMRRADEALYKAKQNGRDSVRLSYERPETSFVAVPLAVG
ncbi:GGDEF domain-containing protein [Mesorhizobium sp. M2D.F.Ca.ET.185.01.1.1]|uniref:GGDEF domain-containing protein n=1 Tax=unclassified Mesorhizobium TaxID=325217 RepID=UPI000FCBFFBD|nr:MULTISPECIES: GGDEF domain-containing protein [unclassified Mesorhizobium]TGP48204.1 GGDEF domain-containing protein [bacterium M00.F.Ca.ET.230.01.1.1]TGP75709.1 GGDEF domain-containing protein [bacterium M00.F.Ca.ET.227.01.1.1]TGP87191.1 GGDEF domain-containing protein [bacterium M00.F.Ca.ET.221.01.1.1]TGP91683.1 GGDEF domain-containing protein [bacterium M00.F.Ca.ET.222.01.1.1]TGT70012.1 GGDEF domain-containing protein [bacterium M00.F.Ca.ET.159.01.1.1]TGT81963.1 GGDEF domain-containing 